MPIGHRGRCAVKNKENKRYREKDTQKQATKVERYLEVEIPRKNLHGGGGGGGGETKELVHEEETEGQNERDKRRVVKIKEKKRYLCVGETNITMTLKLKLKMKNNKRIVLIVFKAGNRHIFCF